MCDPATEGVSSAFELAITACKAHELTLTSACRDLQASDVDLSGPSGMAYATMQPNHLSSPSAASRSPRESRSTVVLLNLFRHHYEQLMISQTMSSRLHVMMAQVRASLGQPGYR